MATRNVNGHGVTNMAGAVHQDVVPANVQFPQAPAHQSGGMGGPGVNSGSAQGGTFQPSASSSKKKFPPAK